MKLGLIGCGKMGGALAQGVVSAGVVSGDNLMLFDVFPEASEYLAKKLGARVAASVDELVLDGEVILLCTKPQDLLPVLESLQLFDHSPRLFLSIAAGVKLASMESALGAQHRVIRAMPNTPALIGKGASAFALGTRATREDAATATELLGAVGVVCEVKEELLDAVTGLSGSGPAFVFTMIEALADGGVLGGLPRCDALKLAAQTVAGAAELVLQAGDHPGVLRDQVTSPGGTTIAGLAALEACGVRSGLISAVQAATERSRELGNGEI